MRTIPLIVVFLIICTNLQAQITKLAEVNILTEKTYDEDYQEALYDDENYVYSVRYFYGKKDKATGVTSKKRTRKVSIDVFDKKRLKRKKAILVPEGRGIQFFAEDSNGNLCYFYSISDEKEETNQLYLQYIDKHTFSLGKEVLLAETTEEKNSRHRSYVLRQTPDQSKWVIVSMYSDRKDATSNALIVTLDSTFKKIRDQQVEIPLPFLVSGKFAKQTTQTGNSASYESLKHESLYTNEKLYYAQSKHRIQTDNEANVYYLTPKVKIVDKKFFKTEYEYEGFYQLLKITEDGTIQSKEFLEEEQFTYSIHYKAQPDGTVKCWGIWANEVDKAKEKKKKKKLRNYNPRRLDGIKYFELGKDLKIVNTESSTITNKLKDKILEVTDRNEYYYYPKRRHKEEDDVVDQFYIVNSIEQADGGRILLLEFHKFKVSVSNQGGGSFTTSYSYLYGPVLFLYLDKNGQFNKMEKVDKAGYVLDIGLNPYPFYGSHHLEKIGDDYFLTYLDFRWVKRKYKAKPFLCIKKLKADGTIETQEIPFYVKGTKEKGFYPQIVNALSLGDGQLVLPAHHNLNGTSLIEIQLLNK